MTSNCIMSHQSVRKKRISTSLNQFLIVSVLVSSSLVIIAQPHGVAARPKLLFDRNNNRPGGRFYHNEQHSAVPWPRAGLGAPERFQANQSHSPRPQQTAQFRLATDRPSQLPSVLRNEGVIRDGYHRLSSTQRPSSAVNQPAMIYSRPRHSGQQPSYTWTSAIRQAYQQPQQLLAAPQKPAASRLVASVLRKQTSSRPPLAQESFDGADAANPLFKSLLSLQNPRLFGGDILLRMGRPQDGRVFKFERSALVSPVNLWPNGVIFYELDPSVAHLARLIWKVMQQFHDETCIRFMPRLNNEPDFMRIEAHKGCFSYIGRVGGEQTLSLGDGCDYRGTIAHELLHAVGFFHHQNRSDRDDFLEILWENIAKGKEGQFEIMPPSENTLLNEFDYNSIMLYGPHTFGKTLDKITMKPKREGVILLEVIEKQGLSALDIDSVNKLYKCEPYAYDTA